MVMRDDPNARPQPPEPVKLRTVMRPWEEIEVAADEAAVLEHAGLVYKGPPVEEAAFDPRQQPPAPPEDGPASQPDTTAPTGKASAGKKEAGQ